MNQRPPWPIVQVELAVDRLGDRKRSVQVFAGREPNARFHVAFGYSKGSSNAGVTAMKQVFDQLLKFLQQGISAIFHFVELIWMCCVDQVSKLMAVPWQHGPLLKQVVLVLTPAVAPSPPYRPHRAPFHPLRRTLPS